LPLQPSKINTPVTNAIEITQDIREGSREDPRPFAAMERLVLVVLPPMSVVIVIVPLLATAFVAIVELLVSVIVDPRVIAVVVAGVIEMTGDEP